MLAFLSAITFNCLCATLCTLYSGYDLIFPGFDLIFDVIFLHFEHDTQHSGKVWKILWFSIFSGNVWKCLEVWILGICWFFFLEKSGKCMIPKKYIYFFLQCLNFWCPEEQEIQFPDFWRCEIQKFSPKPPSWKLPRYARSIRRASLDVWKSNILFRLVENRTPRKNNLCPRRAIIARLRFLEWQACLVEARLHVQQSLSTLAFNINF